VQNTKTKAVMRGLDPRIHLHVGSANQMDGRIKSGHDDFSFGLSLDSTG